MSTRKPLPPATKRRILDRDGHQCVAIMRDGTGRCPETQHLEIDHIHNVARGGGNADSNLQALCPWHHQVKSAWEAAQGVKANRSTSQTHPWHQQPRSKQ